MGKLKRFPSKKDVQPIEFLVKDKELAIRMFFDFIHKVEMDDHYGIPEVYKYGVGPEDRYTLNDFRRHFLVSETLPRPRWYIPMRSTRRFVYLMYKMAYLIKCKGIWKLVEDHFFKPDTKKSYNARSLARANDRRSHDYKDEIVDNFIKILQEKCD